MNTAERLNYQPNDFKVIQSIMYRHAGIQLHDGKQELVYSRLAKRVRNLGFNRFSDYCAILNNDKDEVLHCINSMTTNVTSFFREKHHFEFLQKELFENGSNKKVRIWSAGCATGEEPYSIAFSGSAYPNIDLEIVASDLDSEVLKTAGDGVYQTRDVSDLTEQELRRWFLRGKGARRGKVRVMDHYKKMVSFLQLNLKSDWHHEEQFDVIFCRNVMIYFDSDFRSRLIDKFHQHLKPGGYLILGHSESLFGLSKHFRVAGKTIHKKDTRQ